MSGRHVKRRKKVQGSKLFCAIGAAAGFLMAQECMAIMVYAIRAGFDGTAAWLTAAVGVAEAVIIACINGYFALCKSDHKAGGITYEAAKANGFGGGDSDTKYYEEGSV